MLFLLLCRIIYKDMCIFGTIEKDKILDFPKTTLPCVRSLANVPKACLNRLPSIYILLLTIEGCKLHLPGGR